MLKIDVQARLISAESKPYDFRGNTGTSHKVRVLVDNEIYVCNSTAEQVIELAPLKGTDGKAVLELDSRKESLSLKIASFSKVK